LWSLCCCYFLFLLFSEILIALSNSRSPGLLQPKTQNPVEFPKIPQAAHNELRKQGAGRNVTQ